jgi:hypothetical protein
MDCLVSIPQRDEVLFQEEEEIIRLSSLAFFNPSKGYQSFGQNSHARITQLQP